MIRRTPRSTLTYTRFPYTTLFLSTGVAASATPPESVTAIQRVRNSDQLLNQRFGARPVSVTRCRVQVTHGADLDDLAAPVLRQPDESRRSEEHTSELQSLMRISYAVFCLKKKNTIIQKNKRT